jgi:hypothetical protein
VNHLARDRQRRWVPALQGRRRRAGLAPLELVLSLPILLFVMALIVNIGAVGAWKVREQTNARYASWRTLHLRTGDANPNPPLWPADAAALRGAAGANLDDAPSIWNGVPDLALAPVRGPVIAEPFTGGTIRVDPRLEFRDDVHDGRAPLERRIPLLRGILPNNGRYQIDIPHNLLDGNWEFHELGYSDNADRRARLLYQIEPDDFPSVASLKSALDVGPWQALQRFPQAGDLVPLDLDPDLIRIGRLLVPPVAPSDFYDPGLRRNICLADPTLLQSHPGYQDFLRDIRRLPGRMGSHFRQIYQQRLNDLTPPPPGAQQEIQWLQERISELDTFLGSLPQANR